MLDPIEQAKGGFGAFAERHEARQTARAAAEPPRAAGGDVRHSLLGRLAANRTLAEAAGWKSCALERDTVSGLLRLIGIAPGAAQRTIVPDWTTSVAADARARTDAPPPPPLG